MSIKRCDVQGHCDGFTNSYEEYGAYIPNFFRRFRGDGPCEGEEHTQRVHAMRTELIECNDYPRAVAMSMIARLDAATNN